MRLLLFFALLLPALPASAQSDTASWRHEIAFSLGFVRQTDVSGNLQRGGVEGAYHLLKPLGRFAVGAGGGFASMGGTRNERMLSATVLGSYSPGGRRLRPTFRMLAGVGIPIGNATLDMTDRRVSPVVHPALGLTLLPPRGHWGALHLSLGYRFTAAKYVAAPEWATTRLREVRYRRLTLTLATRI